MLHFCFQDIDTHIINSDTGITRMPLITPRRNPFSVLFMVTTQIFFLPDILFFLLNRVFELSDRTKEEAKEAGKKRIPCKHIVPLPEILADTFSCGVATKKVQTMYDHLISSLGNEFFILESATFEDIESVSTKHIADAIFRVRSGNIVVRPGYDGEFGVVKVFEEGKHSEGIL